MKYKRFKELTVGEYQELYTIARSDDDEVEKSLQLISVLTGLPRWDVENLSVEQFNVVSREIAVIFSTQEYFTKPFRYCRIGKQKYKILYNVRQIKTGQYVDIQHLLQGNIIDNLHRLFSCIILPKTLFGVGKYQAADHEIISERVRNLNFQQVHAACVFFLKLWESSIKATRDFLNKHPQQTEKIPAELLDLSSLTGGYTMPAG